MHKDVIYKPPNEKGPTLASWNKDTVTLTIYVNDLLLVGQNKMQLKQLEDTLVRRFDTKYVTSRWYLGCKSLATDRKGRSPSCKHTTSSRYSRRTAWGSTRRCTRSESDRSHR